MRSLAIASLSYGEFVELIKMHCYGGWQHSAGQPIILK